MHDNSSTSSSSNDDIAAYTSSAVVTIAGHHGYLLLSKNAPTHFNMADGHILWSFHWPTVFDVQPVLLDDNCITILTGFGVGGASIHVEENYDGQFETNLVCRTRWLRPNLSNVAYHKEYFYGLDSGIMVCLDADSGERVWRQGRYGHGQWLLVGGILLVQCETGKVVLVDPQPTEHRELACFEPLQEKTWNQPALAPLPVPPQRPAGCLLPARSAGTVRHRIRRKDALISRRMAHNDTASLTEPTCEKIAPVLQLN